MKKLDLKNVVWKEGDYYVAECLNNHVSSFGKTKEEALRMLDEALELYFEDDSGANSVKVEKPEIVSRSFSHA